MLYKYVKSSRPVIIKQKRNLYITPSYKRRKYVILTSWIFFIFGIATIGFSIYPYTQTAIAIVNRSENVSKFILTAYSNSETSTLNSNYRVATSYSSNVTHNFNSTNKALNISPKTHPELAEITGEMKLTIPKLNLKKLPVIINVNSYDKDIYLPLLESKLAHFKGTSLPDNPGNTFIYGHSANELWARTNPTFPGVAFTYLNKLDIGDEIIIEYKSKEYKYTVERAKIVPPEDISPIFTYSDKKTLTLMTCWPPGVGTDRLIVIASQI